MTPHRETAKIYQFPARTRVAAVGQQGQPGSAGEAKITRMTDVAVGAGWYHEAAVRDGGPTRKP